MFPGGSAAGTLLQRADWLRPRDEGCSVKKPHWPISAAHGALSSMALAFRASPMPIVALAFALALLASCLRSTASSPRSLVVPSDCALTSPYPE